jgi:release factor glutamine methyltransferase
VTLKQALVGAVKSLTRHSIEDAPLEAEVLLRHVLSLPRAQLFSEFQRELTPGEQRDFWDLIKRRLNHEPTAYIIGRREFYGLDFYVDRRVFIPRPETELLVELCLDFARHFPEGPLLVADIGTGCGAIAISLGLNLPQAEVYAIDASAAALEVAFINCQRHGVLNQVHLRQGDMLDLLPEPVDIVVANLPYVKESDLDQLSAEVVNFEPRTALAGGRDGLDWVRRLLSQAEGKLRKGDCLLAEVGLGQGETVVGLARAHFPGARAELMKDLGGIDRVVGIMKI